MVTKEQAQKYARDLMFEMNDEEYETLLKEFEIVIKQNEFMAKIEGVSEVEPMTFPFITYEATLREDTDEEGNELTRDEVLQNAKVVLDNAVKVPKVVE